MLRKIGFAALAVLISACVLTYVVLSWGYWTEPMRSFMRDCDRVSVGDNMPRVDLIMSRYQRTVRTEPLSEDGQVSSLKILAFTINANYSADVCYISVIDNVVASRQFSRD